VAFRRLYVQVGYVPFILHTVRVEDVELDGFAVNVERLPDRRLVLPAPRPAAAPEATAPPPSGGAPRHIAGHRPARPDGPVRLRDDVAEPPETRELALDDLTLSGFSLQYGKGARPAHGVIVAKFGDGLVRLRTRVLRRPEGFAAVARLELQNLPLDRAQVHLPELGWRNSGGRLDAVLDLHADAAPTVSGTVAIRDLHVEVPDEP